MKELRAEAEESQARCFTPAISANAVVFKSDHLIHEQLLSKLRCAVKPLEDVPSSERDWHPGSNKQVLDLVHPSLFPFIYGRSHLLPSEYVSLEDPSLQSGKGICSLVAENGDLQHHETHKGSFRFRSKGTIVSVYSQRFQWLPCDVFVNSAGDAKIRSYINNLHPAKHIDVYGVVEKVISQVLPMWEAALTETFKQQVLVPDYIGSGRPGHTHGYYPPRIRICRPEWKISRPAEFEDSEEKERYWGWVEALENDSYYSRGANPTDFVHNQLWERSGLIQPEPTQMNYDSRARLRKRTKNLSLTNDFPRKPLQVIVKLANIHLTPDSPQYDGGSWHIEGQLNEHICATALLYYDSDNITDSYLAFRERVDAEALEGGDKDEFGVRGYAHYDHEHMELLLGVRDRVTSATQELGHVLCKEGRLIVFPNVLQHRVEAFRLRDATKPGHRKILALFLVDPYIRIPSTANVPSQQRDWWADQIRELDRIGDLPPEIVDMIVSYAGDDLLTLEEAKQLRLELMAERSVFVEDVNHRFATEKFSFCEH